MKGWRKCRDGAQPYRVRGGSSSIGRRSSAAVLLALTASAFPQALKHRSSRRFAAAQRADLAAQLLRCAAAQAAPQAASVGGKTSGYVAKTARRRARRSVDCRLRRTIQAIGRRSTCSLRFSRRAEALAQGDSTPPSPTSIARSRSIRRRSIICSAVVLPICRSETPSRAIRDFTQVIGLNPRHAGAIRNRAQAVSRRRRSQACGCRITAC